MTTLPKLRRTLVGGAITAAIVLAPTSAHAAEGPSVWDKIGRYDGLVNEFVTSRMDPATTCGGALLQGGIVGGLFLGQGYAYMAGTLMSGPASPVVGALAAGDYMFSAYKVPREVERVMGEGADHC